MSTNQPVVDPATFTPEQWAAVNAFADAQARANFAYQSQLPAQQLARGVDNLGNVLVAVFVGFITLWGCVGIPAAYFGVDHGAAGGVAGAVGGFAFWLFGLYCHIHGRRHPQT